MDEKNAPLSPLFEQFPRQNMADRLFEQLRDMIRSGKLEEGYVFPNETEMCQNMQVGRSTLREAYKQLALAGYITRTKRGTRVNDREAVLGAMPLKAAVEESSAEEFREYRYMLEQQTAELAAKHATAEDLDELKAVQRDLTSARACEDVDTMMRLDKAFHIGVASATHNQLLVLSMFAVSAVWNAQVARNFEYAVREDPGALDDMVTDHDAILAALEARDGVAARQAMHRHITRVSH